MTDTILIALGVLVLAAVLFGSRIGAGASWLYARAKSLSLPKFSGTVTVNLDLRKAAVVALAVVLIAVGVSQRGCVMPGWPSIPWIGSTSPIPDAGFRVLIIEETEDRAKLTAGQTEAMFSTDADSLRAYVESKGGTLRVLDDDSDPAMLDAPWQKLMARPRQSLPWLEAANPPRGKEMALPAEESAAITAVKQVGG